MIGRRRLKSEERLSLIKEIKENGNVVRTFRKYGVDLSMFYRWKEIYNTYGVDDFISGTRHSDPVIRNLKKMIAEKMLEVSVLQEAYKKTRTQRS